MLLLLLQIYGADNVFDADRLIDLLGAFETFRSASASATGGQNSRCQPGRQRLQTQLQSAGVLLQQALCVLACLQLLWCQWSS